MRYIFRKSFKLNVINLGSIVFTWIYSACWMVPELFTPNGFVLEGFLTHCSFDYLSRDLFTRVYMILMLLGGFFIPLLFILVLNFLIWHKLKIKSKNFQKFSMKRLSEKSVIRKRLSDQSTVATKRTLSCDSYEILKQKAQEMDLFCSNIRINDFKMINTIILMILLFCLSWGPYALVTIIAQFGTNIIQVVNPYTTSLPALFAKTSSFMNPLIYSFRDKQCRKYLMKKFAGLRKESNFQSKNNEIIN